MDNITTRAIRQEAILLFTQLHEVESKLSNNNNNNNRSGLSLQELNHQTQRLTQNKQTCEKEKHDLIVSKIN